MMMLAVGALMLLQLTRGSSAPVLSARSDTHSPKRPPEAVLPAEPLSLEGAQFRGNLTAKVVLLEYSDFQCPYCGRFARETLPDLQRQYVDTGRVLLAFREDPLEQLHPFALAAAEAAECAGRQGQFWKMHDLTFADQKHLDQATLHTHARAVGLDVAQFDTCLTETGPAAVRADAKSAADLTVSGTPTFFLGLRQSDGKIKVLKRFSGALPLTQFSAELDATLEPAAVSGAKAK
jgi:protein-disulfide isomerase